MLSSSFLCTTITTHSENCVISQTWFPCTCTSSLRTNDLSPDVKKLPPLRCSHQLSSSSAQVTSHPMAHYFLDVNQVSLTQYFQDVCALWPQPSHHGFSLCTHYCYNQCQYLGIFISWKWWWAIPLGHKVVSLTLLLTVVQFILFDSLVFHSQPCCEILSTT